MDICHKSHINQQSHKINKKQYYHETNLHYPLITEPTLNYPIITTSMCKEISTGIFTNHNTKSRIHLGDLRWCQDLCLSLCMLRPQRPLSNLNDPSSVSIHVAQNVSLEVPDQLTTYWGSSENSNDGSSSIRSSSLLTISGLQVISSTNIIIRQGNSGCLWECPSTYSMKKSVWDLSWHW